MNKFTKITLATCLIANASMLYASPNGGYFGAGLGVSTVRVNDTLSANEESFAGKIFGGYKFNKYFGLEASYARLQDQSFNFVQYPWINFEYELSALSLMGKVYLPLNDRFNLNLSFGGADMISDLNASSLYSNDSLSLGTNNTLVAAGGVGAEFNVTENLALNVDFTMYSKKEGNESRFKVPASNLFTLGLSYWF